jgi:hypothetical protein
MTRVRWLLLRPAPDWGLRKAQRRAITAMPGLERVAEAGGWDLFRVRARPSHPEWFDRIAAGPQQGRTVLGTPAIPLDPGATRGALRVPRDAASAQPGAGLRLRPTAVNLGGTAWPVATWETDAAKISLRTTLRSSDSPAAEETVALYDLPRDLFPGEAMSFEVWTKAPREPGGYTLDLDLVQGGTAPLPLVGPRARLAVTVEPEAPQTERSPSRPAAP